MTKRYIPLITESDKELPYFLVNAGQHWNQEHVVRPNGYLYQWIQCVEGEGEVLLDGKAYRVKEGMAMLLFKGTAHEYYAVSSSWIVDWVVFDGHQVDAFLKRSAGIAASGVYYVSRPDILLARIHNVLDIGQSDSALKGIQCSSVIYALLTDIVQYTSELPNNSATSLNFKLKPLFDYIEQNYNRPLSLESLAEVTGVTPHHLCNLFKKTTNIRIFQYINSIRIKKSKELLLQNPQMQVKEIACLSGFEDANYFCSVFKKHEQLSPNQFRKIHY
ncbi:AraC family transcriptional regulator [Paenibacillus sp. N4]|uniref:AraC family transcriptional regulator n=1 Tax=Paenibacillus vietnamensis TaxID=2590547 RepID=UPI001CD07057|nr:AraC family transcriptional regulator [Paenibacillus vietnamensis]MCA0757824.1 AraC family transcriptional regulator [Paenibacillus vietnamensis]